MGSSLVDKEDHEDDGAPSLNKAGNQEPLLNKQKVLKREKKVFEPYKSEYNIFDQKKYQ